MGEYLGRGRMGGSIENLEFATSPPEYLICNASRVYFYKICVDS